MLSGGDALRHKNDYRLHAASRFQGFRDSLYGLVYITQCQTGNLRNTKLKIQTKNPTSFLCPMLKLFAFNLITFLRFRKSDLPPAYLYQKDKRAPYREFDSSKYLSFSFENILPFITLFYGFVVTVILLSSVRCASLSILNQSNEAHTKYITNQLATL